MVGGVIYPLKRLACRIALRCGKARAPVDHANDNAFSDPFGFDRNHAPFRLMLGLRSTECVRRQVGQDPFDERGIGPGPACSRSQLH